MTPTFSPQGANSWKKLAAAAIMALLLVSICLPGLAVLFQPESEPAAPWCKVAALESLPTDGHPTPYPILHSKTNAWESGELRPIGSVFLRRLPHADQVVAFSAASPWLGCQLKYDKQRKCFTCVCHLDEDYDLDGRRLGSNPAPRDMDRLEVDVRHGNVYVKPAWFTPGIATQEASFPE